MGWITLSQRKQELLGAINELTYQDTQYSLEKRLVQRHLAFEQSIFHADQTKEMRAIKQTLDNVRNRRPSADDYNISSSSKNSSYDKAYDNWKEQYAEAQKEYEAKKEDIQDYYDNLQTQAETEATDEETHVDQCMSTIETQLSAMNAELDAVKEEINNEIEKSAISFS